MMQRCPIFVYICVAIVAATGHVQDLRVSVTPIQSRFAFVQKVNVILKYSNIGGDTMSIYNWYLPEGILSDELFVVTRDGQPVEYVGPRVKRREPTAEDIITLTPGMKVSSVVELSEVYNMTQSGNYVIQYKMNANQILFTMGGTLKHRLVSLNEYQERIVQSEPVVVFAVGRRNRLIEEAVKFNTQSRARKPSFIGCSDDQSNALHSAMFFAEFYNKNALQHLNTLSSGTTRYTTWFGEFSSSNLNTLKTHYTKIQNVLSSTTVSFDCTCPANKSDSVYAYVFPSQHYNVYLCNAYWNAPTTGTDSKSGTIIHELAHFTILADTDDHGYGHTKCKELAQTSSSLAIMNSDSLQYFAENSPALS